MNLRPRYLKRLAKNHIKKIIGFNKKNFKITKAEFSTQDDLQNKPTLLLVVGDYFNQTQPNISTLIIEGMAKGWSEVCGPAQIVHSKDLLKTASNLDKPVIYLTHYHLLDFNPKEINELSQYDCCLGVNVHPKKIEYFKNNFLLEDGVGDTEIWRKNYARILALKPRFVWNSLGKSGQEWFQDWIDDGLAWESLHLAADLTKYFPDQNSDKFGQIKMAYVGGYWAEKAQAFDNYFRPFENIFVPFGRDFWPYKNYGGLITLEEERQLYSSAGLIPLVTGPGGWLWSEITERYFKAPACRAFCIADQNPALRDIFNENEMIQATSADHFKGLVDDFLHGKIDTEFWRQQAYKAIIDRHQYKHRALQIKNRLKELSK